MNDHRLPGILQRLQMLELHVAALEEIVAAMEIRHRVRLKEEADARNLL